MCNGDFIHETHMKKIAINVNLIHETRDSCECHSVIVEVLSQFAGRAFQALRLTAPFEATRVKG